MTLNFNRYELRKLLASELPLPSELAYEITGYLVQSDIRKPNITKEVEYIPTLKFRVRHRYLRQLMSF